MILMIFLFSAPDRVGSVVLLFTSVGQYESISLPARSVEDDLY